MAANSPTGRLPPEQVHRVGQRAAPGQLEGVEDAVGLEHAGELDALLQPETAVYPVGHVELGRHRRLVPDRLLAPPRPPDGERARLARLPPQRSVRRFSFGAQEGAQQVVVAEVDLDAVEAGLDGDAAPWR